MSTFKTTFEFRLEGLEDLLEALEMLPTVAMQKTAVRNAMKKALEPVADGYRSKLPWALKPKKYSKSKHLRDSVTVTSALKKSQRAEAIRARPDSVVMYVGSTAPHAHLLEFGTKERWHKKKVKTLLGSKWVETEYTGRVTPRPFLRNAWDASKHEIIPIFAAEMKKNLERAARNLARRAAKGTLTQKQIEGLLE